MLSLPKKAGLASGLLMALLIGGCAALPASGPLLHEICISKVTDVDQRAPFVWHPAGTCIAAVTDCFGIYDTAGNRLQGLSKEKPTAIAWAADGDHLAASYGKGRDSELRIYNVQGRLLSDTVVAGSVTSLAWNNGELLAGALTIDRFSFGSTVKGIIYRWKGLGKPAATTISDTTVRPFIGNWPEEVLFHTFTFAVSPLGNEIVYTRLLDPPRYAPYLKIMIRQLDESGSGFEAASAAIGSRPLYAADGQSIIFGDGIVTRRLDPWVERELVRFPSPGQSIAVSTGGTFTLVDGRLYKNDQEIVTFPASCQGQFSPHGDQLLLRCDGTLYMVSGLSREPAVKPVEENSKKMLSLHRWRSEGLISISDYQSALERILHHE